MPLLRTSMNERSKHALLSNEVNEVHGVKPVNTRSGTMSPLKRVLLCRKPRTPANSEKSTRSPKTVPEQKKATSITAMRLRALAHAVRARHSLGIQGPVQRKYRLQAGIEEADAEVDLLMQGIHTKLKEDTETTCFYANDKRDSDRLWKSKKQVAFANETSEESSIKSPPLRLSSKSATMARGSLSVQRISTFRGDLSSMARVDEGIKRNSLRSTQHFDARLTCAYSLYKLSCQGGTERAIFDGGVIAQLVDFSDVEDAQLLRYSAAVLVNMTTDLSLFEDFASNTVVSALLELIWTPLIDVKVACMTAFCRLSQTRARSALLMRSQATTEFLAMLTVPCIPLQQLVVSCIVNFIFHGYRFLDRIFLGDPHEVQSPLGLLTIINQLSTSPSTSQFALESLFNLSLYRSSCLNVLRGGGAEILYTLVSQLYKFVDGGSSSRHLCKLGGTAPAWTTDVKVCMTMLRLAADTLANFSAYAEYHSIISSHGMKSLILMLSMALRDLKAVKPNRTSVERFQCTSVSCSRALVNFSSNAQLRRQNFTLELLHLTTKLALMDHQRYVVCAKDARTLLRNAIRSLGNLSFERCWRAPIATIPHVLPMFNAIVVLPAISTDSANENSGHDEQQQEQEQEQCDRQMPLPSDERNTFAVDESTRTIASRTVINPASFWYLRPSLSASSSSFPWTFDMLEDVKEDVLLTMLKLAQDAACVNELLRSLDGKLLAAAAADMGHSRKLRYVYASLLCNLLFDSCLQRIVHGDQVVRVLVHGFTFFESSFDHETSSSSAMSLTMANLPLKSDKPQFEALKLAFDDDPERFLASISLIASELMDVANIELVMTLILSCMRTYMKLAAAIPQNAPSTHKDRKRLHQELPILCYASAALFSLTRAATQRRDVCKGFMHSKETEDVLVAVSALPAWTETNPTSSGSLKASVVQAFCAATLYYLCASTAANQRVMQGLVNCCNANDESQPLLACSAAFAIASFTPEGCKQLVACQNLPRALNRLGRTSHVECQQYAAIAACNVATVACVWSSEELKDFIVVALLRANSVQTKQIHVKTLSNLLSHSDSRAQVVGAGVLYALIKLSQTTSAAGAYRNVESPQSSGTASDDSVFGIGLEALFNLSCDRQYHDKLLVNGVLVYLSAAMESHVFNEKTDTSFVFQDDHRVLNDQHQTQSKGHNLCLHSRRLALAIICNLTSYEDNHKKLLHSQVTEIICNYMTEDIECHISASMAIRNLTCRQEWVEMLCERRILGLLLVCVNGKDPIVGQFALEALANCSVVTDSLHLFAELPVVGAVMTLLEITANGRGNDVAYDSISWEVPDSKVLVDGTRSNIDTCMAALKWLYNIAHDDALATIVMEEKVISRLLPLFEYRAVGQDVVACEVVTRFAHVLAGKASCAESLLRQRLVSLCSLLHRRHDRSHVIAQESVSTLMLLSTYQPIQLQLCETQAVHVIVSICGHSNPVRTLRVREYGAIAIRNLTLSVTEHHALFYDDNEMNRRQSFLHFDDLQHDDEEESGNAYDKELPVSQLLERHMLHGITHFQSEMTSDQVSDRILLEASAAIANLSTVKVFRVAMVRLGVIPTLLHVMNHTKFMTSVTTSPLRMSRLKQDNFIGRICAATLHRLVVEEDASIDSHTQLVPSLLSVLRQTNDELEQVRYECEKISISWIGIARNSTTPHGMRQLSQAQVHKLTDSSLSVYGDAMDDDGGNERSDRRGAVLVPTSASATPCVRQIFREKKWTVYVLKTNLSSQAMIPQLEKKQIRTLGIPKLCFQDLVFPETCTSFTTNECNSSRSTHSNPYNEVETSSEDAINGGGYLLPVTMEKHVVRQVHGCDEIVPISIALTLPRAKSADVANTRPIVLEGKNRRSSSASFARAQVGPMVDYPGHSRNFNRQMQVSRRNNRQDGGNLPRV